MPKTIRQNHKYFAIAFFVMFFLGGRPAEFGQENVFFQGFLIQKPVIRIALGLNLEDVHVHASSGMKIYRAGGNYKLLAADASQVRVKGHKEKLTEKFVIQVAQARKKDDAEAMAKELKDKIDRRVYVAQDKENELDGIYQVRVGDFLTRVEALEFIKKLSRLGLKNAWIIREEVTEPTSRPQWVLINDELINLDAATSLYFIPGSPESYLSYNGRNFRGIFVLRGSRRGLLLINILNLEEYLKGVVPGELSPYYFGELEAQKAQAIAARTYALKNIGQFDDLGFDLYATPLSQVYEGMSIEHPLSTRAVDETRGEVVTYDGKLINALYTSTCGGATEDAEKMFEGNSVPYLKSTECVLEKDEGWQFQSPAILPPIQVSGMNVGPKLAYLMALGILPQETKAAYFREAAGAAEAADWIRKALVQLGKKNEKFAPEQTLMNHAAFARIVIEGFQWQERVQNLIGRSETDRATKDFPLLTAGDKNALAYFIISGIYPAFDAGVGEKNRILTRAEAAYYLAKAVSTYKDFYHQGYLKGLVKNKLELMEDDKPKELELAPNIFLLRNMDDALSFTPSFELSGGDVVKWIESEGKIRLLQSVSSSISNVLDNPSQFHRWEVRMSREDLETRLNQYYPIGGLVDLIPQKRGVSKRVIELAIIGRESQVRVLGLKIRQVLNLRDTLFVVDREYDQDGRVGHFLFSGKGWGHGVGLCQVGAYRMAQKGATYGEILKKYYHGIKIDKIY
jgi:stage II sporulation protein D